MAKTPVEKLYLKPEYSVAMLHVPIELKEVLTVRSDTNLKNKYNFILAFYTKKEELKKEVEKIKTSLITNGLIWIVYPKAGKLQTDLSRDILHNLMQTYSLDGVSLISLNGTWSAMRFKKLS